MHTYINTHPPKNVNSGSIFLRRRSSRANKIDLLTPTEKGTPEQRVGEGEGGGEQSKQVDNTAVRFTEQ